LLSNFGIFPFIYEKGACYGALFLFDKGAEQIKAAGFWQLSRSNY